MKKKLLFLLVMMILLSLGFRSRYSPLWKKTPGGIEYNQGDVGVTGGIFVHGTDVYSSLRTVIKTIDLDDDTSTDDFQFNDDAGNSTAQNVDMGAIIPAYAEVVSVHLRCFESVGSGTFQVTLGTSSAGSQLLSITVVDAANEIDGTATGNSPKLETSNAARNVWIQGDPSVNWSAAGDAGRWAVIITYIDYGAIYTTDSP